MKQKHIINKLEGTIELGLWGPSFTPSELDKYGLDKQLRYIKKLENMPQVKSNVSDVYNEGKSVSLTAGILAAVRFTNINLIQMHNRIVGSPRVRDTNR